MRSPLPIFGLDVLHKIHFEASVYLFEGEKCAQAAHYLGLTAITSMMGSSQAQNTDLAILAAYRQQVKQFVLIPDNDKLEEKYIEEIYHTLRKICPTIAIYLCHLPGDKKGSNLVDWILDNGYCQPNWDGFGPFDEPYNEYLRNSFEAHVEKNIELLRFQ